MFDKPAVSVVLELALIDLHRQIARLEIQGDHLTSGIPEYLHASINIDIANKDE